MYLHKTTTNRKQIAGYGEKHSAHKLSDNTRLGFVQRIVKSADRLHFNAVVSIQPKIIKHNEYRRISDRDTKDCSLVSQAVGYGCQCHGHKKTIIFLHDGTRNFRFAS